MESMLSQDVIVHSASPWASPVVLIRKKDGGMRFCVDYRKLNHITKLDEFPLPRIDETLDLLAGAKYFTTLDLASGYWQVPMEVASQEKTAFITHCGLYEFKKMPFGLVNAPATFQRLMELVLAGLARNLDDVLVFGKTLEEHIQNLTSVLTRIRRAGLKLKPKKCMFGQLLSVGTYSVSRWYPDRSQAGASYTAVPSTYRCKGTPLISRARLILQAICSELFKGCWT